MNDDKKGKKGLIPSRNVARFHMEIEPDSLRRVVADGRLMELAHKLSTEASAQISAQIVEKLAEAAVGGAEVSSGLTISTSFIFEGGDFGTVPPRPKWGIVHNEALSGGLLQQLAATEKIG